MTSATLDDLAQPSLTPLQAILLGGLTVGILDGLDALIFFGMRGVAPIRIFQAVAAGLLGPEAFRGGLRTEVLGLALHFLNATIIVAIYILASRRLTTLARRPWLWGPLYGVVAYLVMTHVVIPLSLSPAGPPDSTPVVLNGLFIHIVGVGIPAALFARAAHRPATP